MAITGTLRDIDLFTLVQTLCQDGRDTRLTLQHAGRRADIFIADGNIVHATAGLLTGEEAVIHLLTWKDGKFEVERSVPIPTQTVFSNVLGLLLEGMRRRDELLAARGEERAGRREAEAPSGTIDMTPVEARFWAKRDALLAPVAELVAARPELEGAMLVTTDGLTLVAQAPRHQERSARLGALSAGLLGLSQRTAFQLKHGMVQKVYVTSGVGHIVIVRVTAQLLLVGLLPGPDADLEGVSARMARCARELAEKTEDQSVIQEVP